MATQTACRKFRTSSLRGLAQQELKLLTLSLLFSGIGGLLNGFLQPCFFNRVIEAFVPVLPLALGAGMLPPNRGQGQP